LRVKRKVENPMLRDVNDSIGIPEIRSQIPRLQKLKR